MLARAPLYFCFLFSSYAFLLGFAFSLLASVILCHSHFVLLFAGLLVVFISVCHVFHVFFTPIVAFIYFSIRPLFLSSVFGTF